MPTQPTFTCATCDDLIAHHPVFHLGLAFCCAGCAADGPCMCSYDLNTEPVTVLRAAGVVPGSTVRAPVAVPGARRADVAAESQRTTGDPRRTAQGHRREDEPALADVRG